MPLAYALPFLCDALLYFGALGCLGLLRACKDALFAVPFMLLAGCWLSGALTGQGKPWLRWLPMAVVLPCLAVAGNWPGRFAALPMLAYLPLYVRNNRRAPDYDYAADHFRHSLIVAGFALLLSAMFRSASWQKGLPYLFLYFTLSMTLLRLLRHDERVARSPRFKALNFAGVALVCAAGFGLSQPAILAALGNAWRWFAEHVLLNLALLLLYALRAVLAGFAWLLGRLGLPNRLDAALPSLPEPALGNMLRMQPAVEPQQIPPLLRLAIQAAGVALLAALVFVILRALSRRVARTDDPSVSETREALDADPPPRPRRLPGRRRPEDDVRQWYRRALALIRARHGKVAPTMNTLQIQEANPQLPLEAMRQLRAVYLPVRYGGRKPSAEDVRRAKAAYEQLRKG